MAGPVWLIWRLLPCYQDDLGYQVVLCLHCLPDNGRKNPVIEVYWGGGGGGGGGGKRNSDRSGILTLGPAGPDGPERPGDPRAPFSRMRVKIIGFEKPNKLNN